MGRFTRKKPMYSLPHGIEIIGEYPPRGENRYWRVRVKAHPFFSAPIISGGQYVRRSRVVMSSILGRALLPNEVVHHKDENVNNDSPDNLELTNHAAHNEHHKAGTRHSDSAKEKISKGLTRAIREGRRDPPPRICWKGKTHSAESKLKMSASKKDAIASGRLKAGKPPVMRGEANSKTSLKDRDVIEIRERAGRGEHKLKLAKEYGIGRQSIYNIINRVTWRHL